MSNELEIKGNTLKNIKAIISKSPQIHAILETALEYSDMDTSKDYIIEMTMKIIEKE